MKYFSILKDYFLASWILLILLSSASIFYFFQQPALQKNDFNFTCYNSEGELLNPVNNSGIEHIFNQNEIPNFNSSDQRRYVKLNLSIPDSKIDYISFKNSTIDIINTINVKDHTKVEQNGQLNMVDGVISAERLNSFYLPFYKISEGAYEILFEISCSEQFNLDFTLESPTSIIEKDHTKDIFIALYVGIVLAIIMYNLFLFFSVRESIYLIYVLNATSILITQIVLQGYGPKLLWSNSIWMTERETYFAGALSGIFTALFAQRYLRLNSLGKLFRILIPIQIAFYSLSILLAIFGFYSASYNIINMNAITAPLLMYAGLKSYVKGLKSAIFFLYAWTFFLIGVFLFSLANFGIIPSNDATIFSMPIGSAIECILLSFGLAYSINQLKREKEAAQAREIQVMKYNEDIIKNQNLLLENKVHERTIELESANLDLQTSYNDLRMTQKQLLESEKLASLGQMTAGIAHELNNPINFVSSNVGPLRRDVEDIVGLLIEYHDLGVQATPKQLDELRLKYSQKDIDFARLEISQLLQGIEEGSKRTSEIVKGLRIFARADKDTIVNANINDCLNSTLVVMKSAYKGDVNLSREVDMQMPEVDCYPGKLNQVLVNIINNAVHATNLPGRAPKDRVVLVKSYFDDNNIYISIKDNGCGIPPEVKDHMFEPFFTTKAVGEGTGLGLAIVLGIIEEHDGKIEVFTEKDKGTEFIIHLPRHRNKTTLTAA
jgi:two-component system, NtrC family, sensor kinase